MSDFSIASITTTVIMNVFFDVSLQLFSLTTTINSHGGTQMKSLMA